MLKDFYKDLNEAKAAERLVRETLTSLAPGYIFEDVSDVRECRYLGDIKAINKETGEFCYVEVKNDSRIGETHNVLCEYENYIKDGGYFIKGNM